MVDTNPEKTIADAGAKSAIQALLTLERAQKLDLLKHLITNLQQSLVVCGPEGIGKTTLLENLLASKSDSWNVYSTKVTAQLSFEQAQTDLLQYLQQSDQDFAGQNLEQILHDAEKNNRKIVFLIDDAGLLVPGLIASFCQFASTYPALRVVFALTADELHIKTSSDKAVDDCHFIDIPALSEQQCGDLLKNLASKPGAIISAENLNSAMIARLYRETHGIPGKIVNAQKPQIKISSLNNWQWISAAAAVLIAVVVSFFLWDDDTDKPEKQRQQIEENLVKKQAEVMVEKAVPYPSIIEDIETMLPASSDIVSVEIESPVIETPSNLGKALSESIDLAKTEIKGAEVGLLNLKETVKETVLEPESANVNSEPAGVVDENKVVRASVPEVKENQETLIKETRIETTKKAVIIDPETQDKAVTVSPKILSGHKEIITSSAITKDKNIISKIPDEEAKTAKKEQKPLVKPTQIKIPEKVPSKVVKQKIEQPAEQKPARQATKKTIVKSRGLQGTSWVLDQNASHYSLQLMAISKQRKVALLKTINKYSQLQDKLHYFETVKKGEKKYVLLYGSFSTSAEAKQAIGKLPKEFSKPWLRSFKVLHKQIKRN